MTYESIVNICLKNPYSFGKGHYTLCIFIDLLETFETVGQIILIKKLEIYGVKGINLAWLRSYLTNRKQHTSINYELITDTPTIRCGVPQGSILGPFLFLLYVNHLHNSSVLGPIIFADDTNLFLLSINT